MKRAVGFLLLGLLAGSALAANSAIIEQRQQAMKDMGGAVKLLGEMAQGKKPFDAATVKTQGEILVSRLEKAKDLFPPDSAEGPPETYAKPDIWKNPADFDAHRQKAHEAAVKLAAVTDEAGLKEGLNNMGAACKSCHETYRRPKS